MDRNFTAARIVKTLALQSLEISKSAENMENESSAKEHSQKMQEDDRKFTDSLHIVRNAILFTTIIHKSHKFKSTFLLIR